MIVPTMQTTLLAEAQFAWEPSWQIPGLVTVAALAALVWLAFRIIWGRATVDFTLGFVLLRISAITVAIAILLGPTIVNIQPGAEQRFELVYLLDGSSSMQLGQEKSRWDEAVGIVSTAHDESRSECLTDISGYRFGHRIIPLDAATEQKPLDEGGSTAAPPLVEDSGSLPQAPDLDRLTTPQSSDSRLADGLRQLLPRMNLEETEGVVLVSDGRIRSVDAVESLAEYYGEVGVPIHVLPVGQSQGTGDIAIVSLVVESTVRKYTQNELKIFFRSFGFNGERTEVRLFSSNPITGKEEELSSIPVTLSGGAQSATLNFRIEAQPLELKVAIDSIEGELATTNNEVTTSIDVDRTKIRVLYVEGAPQQRTLRSSNASVFVDGSTQLNVPQALGSDEDIECTMLYAPGRGQTTMRIGSSASSSLTTFPKTKAELFSFDCVIFSNCSLDVIDENSQKNLEQWVAGRGGGLILAGSKAIRDDAWSGPSAKSLSPFVSSSLRFEAGNEQSLLISQDRHPILQLARENRTNQQLLAAMPKLTSELVGAALKPTAVKVATNQNGTPWFATLMRGRGRVFASAAGLAGQAMQGFGQQWGTSGVQTTSRFWRNLVYWTTEGSSVGRRRLVVSTDKQFYRPGDRLEISASAYDEGANKTQDYRIYAMLEPASLEDMSIFSSILWPDNITRDSGEVGPRIAWGEELLLPTLPLTNDYRIEMDISESGLSGDTGMRIELTAYEGEESESSFGHGTQVDSSSISIQILSDPFEQQNPLPNHEFLEQVARVSGGQVLQNSQDLKKLIESREAKASEPRVDTWPAWSRWWVWAILAGMLSVEWLWRKLSGYA